MRPFLLALAVATVSCSHASKAQVSAVKADTGPDQWCHAAMQAADGTQIRFDYQVAQQHPDQYTYLNVATNPWLNLTSLGWQGSESVHIAFMTYSVSFKTSNPDGDATLQSTAQLTPTWDGVSQKWTVAVPGTLPTEEYHVGDDETFPYRYQIAVEVNGTWLVDPISTTHNFRYWPYNQATGACRGYGINVN